MEITVYMYNIFGLRLAIWLNEKFLLKKLTSKDTLHFTFSNQIQAELYQLHL